MKTALWSLALAIAFGGLLVYAIVRGEPESEPFPETWVAWLQIERPRGHFAGNEYRYCDRGVWVVYKSNGDWYATSRPCWLDQMPRFFGGR